MDPELSDIPPLLQNPPKFFEESSLQLRSGKRWRFQRISGKPFSSDILEMKRMKLRTKLTWNKRRRAEKEIVSETL